MIRILFIILIFPMLLFHEAIAQNANPVFVTKGKIEFEYKINIFSQMQDYDNDSWKDWVKRNMPQFKTSYYELAFDGNKTLYQPGRENPDNLRIWFGSDVAYDNVVYSDLATQQAVSQKHVFEKTFLIKDSVRQIKWKITSETREIAGFQCRRANALIMDSIYVVAFYTDEITTEGGPESFAGLPGMILGVALPHQHITWFATKLTVEPLKPSDLKVPTKGTAETNASLKKTMVEGLSDWGKYGRKYIVDALL